MKKSIVTIIIGYQLQKLNPLFSKRIRFENFKHEIMLMLA